MQRIIFCRSQAFAVLREALFRVLLLVLLLPTVASASPLLRCQVTYAGATRVLEFAPVADPYRVEAVDIDGRFRFKAVVIGDEQRVDYVSLYSYYEAERQAVLLHQAKYLAPVVRASSASNAAPGALTGQNHLYAPGLERELQYACALVEVAR